MYQDEETFPIPGNDAATHVLEWVPPQVLRDRGFDGGGWYLRTRADWDTGTPRETGNFLDLPRDASPGDLLGWVITQLGYLVILSTDVAPMRVHVKWGPVHYVGRWREMPIYYVIPEG